MFKYPSMPPSKVAACMAHHSTNVSQGPQLLLFSLASATAAASITAGRLVLSETGTVLLILSGNSYERLLEGVDYDLECTQNLATSVGNYLIAAASSAHVRAVPLILIFLSSAAFVVGIILIRKELCVYFSRFEPIIGKDWNELLQKSKRSLSSGKKSLEMQLEHIVECIDSMVADNIIRKIVRTGNEMVTCAAGGYALYSLPDQILLDSSSNKTDRNEEPEIQSSRRKIIYAMDPTLDDVLFRPGGIWKITPGLREYLLGLTRMSNPNKPEITFADAPTVDSTANESDSHELDEKNKKSQSHGSLPTLIHVCQSHQTDECSIERVARGDRTETKDTTNTPRNINNARNHQRQPVPRPQMHLEKILQKTAMTASFCFLLHLHQSPSTRKTWKSAMHFITSCGLLTTAVGAGAASLVSFSMNADNSMVGSVCLKAVEGITLLSNSKIRDLLNKFRNIIKSNRKLHMALAFAVLYGFKQSQISLREKARRRR